MANKAAFARASRAGHRAGKPGSAAYKAAFRKAFKSRRSSPKRAARRAARRTRRAARRSAPRRRRTRMARKRKSGGRRKGFVVTPKSLVKLGVVGAGLLAAKPLVEEVAFILKNPMSVSTTAGATVHAKQLVSAAIPPAALILVGPKLVDAGVKLASKGTSVVNRVANAKIVRV